MKRGDGKCCLYWFHSPLLDPRFIICLRFLGDTIGVSAVSGSSSVAAPGRPATEKLLVSPANPLEVTTPPALSFPNLGGLWVQVVVGVCLKGFTAGIGTEVVPAPMIIRNEVRFARVHPHVAHRVSNELSRCSAFAC